jgi:hypothetical protein
MCIGSVSLVYGLAVTTSSLVFAAEAYPQLKGPLLFLDLITLRMRRGTLAVGPQARDDSAVFRLPSEITEKIVQEVVAEELDRAENRFVKEILGVKNSSWWTWEDVKIGFEEDDWSIADKIFENFRPSAFLDDARQIVRFLSSLFYLYLLLAYDPPLQRMKRLLEAYGLALPPTSLRFLLERPETEVDLNAVTFITVATKAFEDGARYNSEHDRNSRNYDYLQEENFSPVSFYLPTKAHLRFLPFLRLFGLVPLKIDAVPPLPPVPRPANAHSWWTPPKGPQFRFTEQEAKEAQPGWKLHSSISVW